MAFYEDRVEHFGGALVLFKRNLSVAVPNAKSHRKQAWYMRLKIGGRKGYITRSTKLTTYEDAYEYAKNELLRLQHAANKMSAMWYVTKFSILFSNYNGIIIIRKNVYKW